MTAQARLKLWRNEQRKMGLRVGTAEEIMWLCLELDELESELDRMRDRMDDGT